MKIKLAILESDQTYLNRFVSVFGTKYSDKFQIYSFTDLEVAYQAIDTAKIEVLVATENFDIDVKKLPSKCGFAYFVDSMGIDTLNNHRAICKFQKADLIYKQILSIYSENAANISGLKFGDDNSKIIMFEPVSGGVGSSTLAAACAMFFAKKNKKTLYLNLEKIGMSDAFFEAQGNFDMSDIIFAIKSKKTNLPMKLESCVKQDNNGVFFYSAAKIALDMLELNFEDVKHLIRELRLTGSYDYIVIDSDFSIDRSALEIYRQVHSLVLVSDGSEISNMKLRRVTDAINILDQNSDSSINNRLAIMYNKFSSRSGKVDSEIEVRTIGGAPRYESANMKQIARQLSQIDVFEKLM